MQGILRSKWLLSAAFTLLGLSVGCSSIKLTANKDDTVVRKLTRLFIVIQHGEVDPQRYSKELAQDLRNAFTNVPIATELSIANPVELDESAHLKRISAFDADAVLVIRAVGGVISELGGYPTIIYDASLYEPELNKRLWRARIDNSGGTAVIKRRMREMAERLVDRLRTDGFL